jgi:signal transduction histidine kinase
MTLSIRARLTLWYSGIVVAVLATGAVAGSLVQSRLALQRLDAELGRGMATLEGVMRTEFTEGLGLEAAAAEASTEVVVPDRALLLMRPDGSVLERWGLPLALPPTATIADRVNLATLQSPSGEMRVLSRRVTFARHLYVAAVIAPLAPLQTEHAVMVRAMTLGVLVALIGASAGGWLIGRLTLKPLSRMAEQTRQINERNPRDRLQAPPVDDELGRLAAAFNALLDRLASALTSQKQFMADASHQLRTPVSVIRTATQVTLAKEARSADEYRESLVIIGEQATRLARLVDAMFLLARAEAHEMPLRREFLNLDDVLSESVRAVRLLANERSVTVTADGDEEVGLIGDDMLLHQMVGNLLDNAVRHAQPRGRIVAELKRVAASVTLRVTNDGPGIDPADQRRIFDRFVRIGSAGAGLGLPIARLIAEAHGGTLELEGSWPGSTTFVVTLPLAGTPAVSSSLHPAFANMR